MNLELLLQILNLTAGVIKSRTSDHIDDKIDEATALARIVAAGRQAYEDHTGEPLDESKIHPQDPIG